MSFSAVLIVLPDFDIVPRRCFALVHHVRKQDDLQYHAIPSSLIPVIRKLYKS